jgi:hypothetical protein
MTSPGGPPVPSDSSEVRRDDEPRDWSRIRTSILVGLVCFLIYNANGRAITAGDTYPARYLPFAIVEHHTVLMNPIERIAAQGRPETAFWMLRHPKGHIVSLYPVVVPVVVSPLYIPAVAYLHDRGWTDARMDYVARVMEKFSASMMAALSAALMYLALRRRTTNRNALLLTFAYALGTTTWVISSQALWQHGLAQLLAVASLLLLTGRCTTPRAIVVALLCGLLAGNRPPDAILAAALGVYALFWAGRRRALLLAIVAALPMAVVLFYNVRYCGSIGGGYGVLGNATFFHYPILQGLAGLLVSPTRGLLVFSPFLIFAGLIVRHLPARRDDRLLALLLGAAVILQLLLYAKIDWRGGMSWGPRYMTDLLPFLIWLLIPVVDALRNTGRVLFHVAVAISIAIQAIGAFAYDPSLDAVFASQLEGADKMKPAWEWKNSPILTSIKNGLAPRELFVEVRGTFDAVESGGVLSAEITAGEKAAAIGWTLAGDETPWQVAVVIDGRRTFATTTFTDRADVRATLQETNPAGWRIPIDTAGLASGDHRFVVLVWPSARSDVRYLTERIVTVRNGTGATPATKKTIVEPPDLRESAAKAAAQIRVHQRKDGFWLTSFTDVTRHEQPRPEMNTFLTSLLVDLLDPIAETAGLDESVRNARQHLARQIEPGGLVRYHGRPDGPGIGSLGCVITPDTDDTALVWRIAPAADRTQLTSALATIDRYRTTEGLYRSWLAPRDSYQCLDPGRDPNPTDVAIQIHLLLLLSEVRPDAGRALCTALRGAIDEDRIWVYYAKTPLVPMLRLPDLDRAGCRMQLPESRTRTDVAGQTIWLTVAQMLAPAERPDPMLMRAVLRELARDDFALLRTNPPLLYHNDLTATVPRYYWSEDAGYALWLRLHETYRHSSDPKPGL